jgi:DNA-binding NarL/FixJ family response regulator
LSEIFGRDPRIDVIGHHGSLGEALHPSRVQRADLFLVDAAFTDGLQAVDRIRKAAPAVLIVAFAVIETEENILAWAEAGVAGYVPSTAGLADLTSLVHDISNGMQPCSAKVAAGLLRRIAGRVNSEPTVAAGAPLTLREAEIINLIDAGLSNKEIARRLAISVATTKSHVHSLLGKLNVQSRGLAAAQMRRRQGYGGIAGRSAPQSSDQVLNAGRS